MKHRGRFVRLASLFLSSTHLPAYIVASFAKRLVRLALAGPPHAALICIPFVRVAVMVVAILYSIMMDDDDEKMTRADLPSDL